MKRLISAVDARIRQIKSTEEGMKELNDWCFAAPFIALEIVICIDQVFFA